jgi:hypothetical protein
MKENDLHAAARLCTCRRWDMVGGDLQQCAHVQLDWHVYAFEVQRLCSRNCKPNMIALPLRSQEVDFCSWAGGGGVERGRNPKIRKLFPIPKTYMQHNNNVGIEAHIFH